jgi:hypothetical protein
MRKAERNRPRRLRQLRRLKRQRQRREGNLGPSAPRVLFRLRRPNRAKKAAPQKVLALERLWKSRNRPRPPPRRRPRGQRRRPLQWKRRRLAKTPKPPTKVARGRQNGSSLARGKAAEERPVDTLASEFAIPPEVTKRRSDCLKLEGSSHPVREVSALIAQHGVPPHLVPHVDRGPGSRTTSKFETVSRTIVRLANHNRETA